jgi:hypothetical protein
MSEGNSELEIIETRPVRGRRKKKNETLVKSFEASEAPAVMRTGSVATSERVAVGGQSALDEKKELSTSGVVEVEVVKLCLNPRLLIARYKEGTVERVIKVKVGVNRNFRPRMKFALERPVDSESRVLPWEYRGRRPRLPGRW